jgi:hypothetical protein
MTTLKTIALAAALLVASAHASGQGAAAPPDEAKVKEEIRKLLGDLDEAMSKKDRAALERIYADEFRFVHGGGNMDDKAANIANIMSIEGPRRPLPIPSLDGLLVYGDVAVYRTHDKEAGLWATAVYARKGGRWQIVQLQSTYLALDRPTVTLDAKTLDAYAGTYSRQGGVSLTLAREGDHLLLRSPGRPNLVVAPIGDAQFVYVGINTDIRFFKDEQGRVTHFVQRLPNGREVTWKRAAP